MIIAPFFKSKDFDADTPTWYYFTSPLQIINDTFDADKDPELIVNFINSCTDFEFKSDTHYDVSLGRNQDGFFLWRVVEHTRDGGFIVFTH